MTGNLPRILLAEDNNNDLELTMAALRSHRVVNDVDVVRDGAEALDYLYRRGPFAGHPRSPLALVLLDLNMPKVNGLEVLRQIKTDPDLRLTPVVMLTSSREEVDLLRSYELGVNAYVVKPVAFGEFMEAVKQLGAFWAVLNERPSSGTAGASRA
jgi:CheY-like chemotaxis protein